MLLVSCLQASCLLLRTGLSRGKWMASSWASVCVHQGRLVRRAWHGPSFGWGPTSCCVARAWAEGWPKEEAVARRDRLCFPSAPPAGPRRCLGHGARVLLGCRYTRAGVHCTSVCVCPSVGSRVFRTDCGAEAPDFGARGAGGAGGNQPRPAHAPLCISLCAGSTVGPGVGAALTGLSPSLPSCTATWRASRSPCNCSSGQRTTGC